MFHGLWAILLICFARKLVANDKVFSLGSEHFHRVVEPMREFGSIFQKVLQRPDPAGSGEDCDSALSLGFKDRDRVRVGVRVRF